ncbi:MAG TPA: O-antigen ligase family protein [Bryobacteraceae bacterium]|nr:O-antigen ligase family protein [Bryobacteraceae bacterium]
MTSPRGLREALPVALAVAILANILVAWTPRYWSTTVGITGISLVALLWALFSDRVALPRESALAILIGFWSPLQLLLHMSSLPSLTMRSSLVWIMCAAVFILASQILSGQAERHAFLRLILWTGTIIAVASILQAYSKPVRVFGIFPADPSVVGTMYYKNHFAALMELIAPIALWEVKNGKLLAGGLCYSAMFAATVTSASRGGTIGILAELLVFMAIMVMGRKLKLGSALAATGVLALLVVAAGAIAGTDIIWSRLQEANPYHLREQLTRSALDMAAERPAFGFGMGTWRAVYPRFARFDDGLIANEAHNDLVQWAAEGGVPFLLLMTGLLACLTSRIFRSVWALGLIAVFAHCYVDYALRAPPLQFLWFALAGAVSRYDAGSRRRQ